MAPRPQVWHNVMVKLELGEYRDLAALAHTEERKLGPMTRILVREAIAARKVKP
jgi:hypothetical protein